LPSAESPPGGVRLAKVGRSVQPRKCGRICANRSRRDQPGGFWKAAARLGENASRPCYSSRAAYCGPRPGPIIGPRSVPC
jgi:hypothetical protein